MRRYYIEQKLKSAAAFLIILILLPYIVSVFVSGTGVRADRKEEETYVQVKTEDARGEIQTEELGWTEYLVGILSPCIGISRPPISEIRRKIFGSPVSAGPSAPPAG